MKFIIATNNKKKLKELSAILSDFNIDALSLRDAGIESDVEETGLTFEENAKLKAEAAMKISGLPAVADDSGLMVEALGGEPGIYSARYGGELCANDTERYEYLLKNMEGKENRRAKFVSSICCIFPDGREIITRGEIEGEILTSPQGEGGFGYDPVFFVPEEGLSMAEITAERKNEISHRARSLALLRDKLKEIL